MRIASVGAFPFPHVQGSQVYARDQARALAARGDRVTLFCYGTRDPRAIDTHEPFDVVRISRALSPASLSAGPSFGKPLADAALCAALVRAHRKQRFDTVVAHNAEAAVAALLARPRCGFPVVYAVHTLLGNELDAYGPARGARALQWLGAGFDRAIALRVDAVIALSRHAARRLGPHAGGPIRVLPPGLDPTAPPSEDSIARSCARHGLEREGFVLYTGNLDPYQELGELELAATRLPEVPVVVATHGAGGSRRSPLREIAVDTLEEMRALCAAAAVAVLPRRRAGGFPIKLLNYMEAGRAIVAREGIADTLEHQRSGWLIDPAAPAEALADGISAVWRDRALAARLGRGARAVLESAHAWPALAEQTGDLLETAVSQRRAEAAPLRSAV